VLPQENITLLLVARLVTTLQQAHKTQQ